MLTFEMLIASTGLLLFPVIYSFINFIKDRKNVFLQMILGYNVCYFLKNFYALINRTISGIENDRIELDIVALLGTFSFLIAAEFCLCCIPDQCKCNNKTKNTIFKVSLLIGTVAMATEGVASFLESRTLFIFSYVVTVICIYIVTIISMKKIRCTKYDEVK